jgi:hypothetical protein
VQGGPFYSYECKAFQNPTLHQPAKRYKTLKRFYNIKYKKWGGLQMNLDTTKERYLFVNFHGLRVTFPTSHICIALCAMSKAKLI